LATNEDVANLAELRTQVPWMSSVDWDTRVRAVRTIASILYRALAVAEIHAPVSVSGSFILAGNALDAMAAIGKVLQTAKRDVLIVDPYMDEKALTDFAPLAAEGIATRLLADQQLHKPTLDPAQKRWAMQYGAKRPLEVRLAAPKILHDRLIVVDEKDTWDLTQSMNAFAARSPASIVRNVDPEITQLKIAAFAAIWAAATPL
jgi:hypothetical protein